MIAEFIPSPGQGVWHLGPIPIRAYALCIIAGVIAAVWFGERRWAARGGTHGEIGDIAIWGVPFGLVGARLYHVATDHYLYFGKGGHPLQALEIWHGGLGIWGAIAGGILGGAIAARRRGIRMLPLLDALAPALLLAQAIGRWGNYFNQELFGRATTLPWGLKIDPSHWPNGRTFSPGTVFHPTFLYESLWNLSGVGLLLWADRRFDLGRGRVFALYVMVYTAGRGWIESLRIDTIELNNVLGLRWGVWMSIVLFVVAAIYFVWAGRKRPGREETPYVEGHAGDDAAVSGSTRGGKAKVDASAEPGADPRSGTASGSRKPDPAD
ncbi:MAG: prolipoprotein diacylglyceryl transferase [Actinomycetota bacterium]|nr:prolipoprotein diacylglyceryl transferase [Actinomycetota bacterium]